MRSKASLNRSSAIVLLRCRFNSSKHEQRLHTRNNACRLRSSPILHHYHTTGMKIIIPYPYFFIFRNLRVINNNSKIRFQNDLGNDFPSPQRVNAVSANVKRGHTQCIPGHTSSPVVTTSVQYQRFLSSIFWHRLRSDLPIPRRKR